MPNINYKYNKRLLYMVYNEKHYVNFISLTDNYKKINKNKL